MKNIYNLFFAICAYKIGKVIFWFLVSTWYVYCYILFYIVAWYVGWMFGKNLHKTLIPIKVYYSSWIRGYNSKFFDSKIILRFYFLQDLIETDSLMNWKKISNYGGFWLFFSHHQIFYTFFSIIISFKHFFINFFVIDFHLWKSFVFFSLYYKIL